MERLLEGPLVLWSDVEASEYKLQTLQRSLFIFEDI
jgi:hypothetical protein